MCSFSVLVHSGSAWIQCEIFGGVRRSARTQKLKICFNAAQSAAVATKEWKFCAPERAFWQQMLKFWQILAKLDEKYQNLHKNIEFCSKTLVFDFDLHPKHPPNFLDIIGHLA